jgi:hypothetical protein
VKLDSFVATPFDFVNFVIESNTSITNSTCFYEMYMFNNIILSFGRWCSTLSYIQGVLAEILEFCDGYKFDPSWWGDLACSEACYCSRTTSEGLTYLLALVYYCVGFFIYSPHVCSIYSMWLRWLVTLEKLHNGSARNWARQQRMGRTWRCCRSKGSEGLGCGHYRLQDKRYWNHSVVTMEPFIRLQSWIHVSNFDVYSIV